MEILTNLNQGSGLRFAVLADDTEMIPLQQEHIGPLLKLTPHGVSENISVML